MLRTVTNTPILTHKRFLLGITISIVSFYIFVSRMNINELVESLKQPTYSLVVPAILLYILSMVWRTVRFRILLAPIAKTSFSQLWTAMSIGYAINNILPVRIGDLVRIYLVSRYQKVSKSSTFATIVAERVTDGIIIMILVGISAPVVPLIALFQGLGDQFHINWLLLTLGMSLPFFLILIVVLTLIFRPGMTHWGLQILAKIAPRRISRILINTIIGFERGLYALKRPKGIALVGLVSFPIWLSEFGVYLVLAYGFNIDNYFGDLKTLLGSIVLIGAIANLGTNIPSSNGGLGTFEFFSQSALIFFAVDPTVASIYVMAVHATIILPITLIGVSYIVLGNLSVQRLVNNSKTILTRS